MIAVVVALVGLMVLAGPAQAEPISAAIGLTALINSAITGAVGFGTAGTIFGLTAGQIGGAIVAGALSIGASIAAAALTPKPSPQTGASLADFDRSAGINTPEQRYTTRQSIPPKRVIYGRAQVGGALFFEQVKPPYLYIGLLINEGEIDEIESIWIGANKLSFAALTPDAILTPLAVDGQPNYKDRVLVSIRRGSDDQAIDPLLAQDFTNLASTFRQRGIATAVFRFHFGADQAEFTALWGQVARPNVLMLVRGIKVYDPRDPTQDIADAATWKWGNQASLVQADYLSRNFGGRIVRSRVDWTKNAEAADYDEELVGAADGTMIKRYTIDGVVTLDQRPFEVMQSLLSANRGRVIESNGRVWVTSSRPRTPVATIHDAILAGGIQYRAAKPKRELVNKLQTRFVAAEQDYQIVDGPILNRADLQAVDGETLPATLSIPFTLDHRRAQRLGKAFLATARLGRTLSCRVDVVLLADAADDLVGNAVRVDSELFAAANGIYLVTDLAFADNFSALELTLIEYDAALETDWNFAVDEEPFELADLDVS